MKRLYYFLFLIGLAIISFTCRKTGKNFISNDADKITATLQGKVISGGAPVAGVTIKLGDRTATTDPDGNFRIVNAPLNTKATVVSAEKASYFKTYRTFSATAAANYVEIELIFKFKTGSVNTSTGGSVSLANGSKIELPAGAVTKAAGVAYSGPVDVYAAYIDPTSSSASQIIPGSLLATDKNGNRVILNSYGMLAVELETPAGEKLQIAKGKKAILTTAVPASLQASAPATISLWSMDAGTGLWTEEGTATKTGNNYVGEVGHFSYWVYGTFTQTVSFTATFVDGNNAPLPIRCIKVKTVSGEPAGWGYTDSLGQVSGAIPANMSLVLEVESPCHTIDHTQNIGPFASNVALGAVVVSPALSKTIKGRILNCSGNPVTSGYAIIWYGNYYVHIPVNSSGNFSTELSPCNGVFPTCKIVGVDNVANQQTATLTVALSGQVNDAGNISACGISSIQELSYSIDGGPIGIFSSLNGYSFWGADNGWLYPGEDFLSVLGAQSGYQFRFVHNGMTGIFPMTYFMIIEYTAVPLIPPFNVTLTNHPNQVGEFYEGTFSGQYQGNNNVHLINSTFRIRRSS